MMTEATAGSPEGRGYQRASLLRRSLRSLRGGARRLPQASRSNTGGSVASRGAVSGRAIPGHLRAGGVPGRCPVADAQPQGLDILVHPLTDDMVDDHSVYALWLGTPVKLKLETMQRRGYGAALLPAA